MNVFSHATVAARHLRSLTARRILSHRLQVRHPTMTCDPTAIWDYGFHDIDAIEVGQHVSILPFVEIVVQKRNRFTSIEGRLTLGDRSVISAGANIRAAGGTISIGPGSGVGQHSVVVAATHPIKPGTKYLNTPYD